MRVKFLLFLIWASVASAHQPEDGDIYATLGALAYKTDTLDHGFHSPVFVAPGLLVEGDIEKHGGVEAGLFYLRNPFSVRQDGKILTEYLRRIFITLGYRHWFTPKFSTGLDFFSSYSMGDPHTIHDDFNNSNRPGISAQDTTEYGFELSVQYEPWHFERWGLVLDGRYAYSVTAKKNEDSNHYGAFVGVKYFVQSRETDPAVKAPAP